MNEWVSEIKIRAKTGKVPVSSGRSKKMNILNFESLVFAPSQLGLRPIDYFKDEIKSEVIIGKLSKHPVTIKSPLLKVYVPSCPRLLWLGGTGSSVCAAA